MRLDKNFFQKNTKHLARDLLGTFLVHKTQEGTTVGKIVETEAYLFKNDPASHAARGKTKRNAPMFEAAGNVYVYFIYGVHYCFNIVSGKEHEGEAVLIRALEPIKGIELMQKRRGPSILPKELCNGPAKLVQAMGINKTHNQSSLLNGPLALHDKNSFSTGKSKINIVRTTRIGINLGAELPLRFYIQNSEFISKK